jgi:hypothetical protein
MSLHFQNDILVKIEEKIPIFHVQKKSDFCSVFEKKWSGRKKNIALP